jgi:hypothetical protein
VSWLGSLFARSAGPGLRARMEAESRQWMCRCLTCGTTRSVWEAGGVRYRAAGRSRVLLRCPTCRRLRCHLVFWGGDRPAAGAPAGTTERTTNPKGG